MEPASSRTLVGFITAKPRRELPGSHLKLGLRRGVTLIPWALLWDPDLVGTQSSRGTLAMKCWLADASQSLTQPVPLRSCRFPSQGLRQPLRDLLSDMVPASTSLKIFFFWCAQGMWKFLGQQGLTPSHGSNQSHSHDDAGSSAAGHQGAPSNSLLMETRWGPPCHGICRIVMEGGTVRPRRKRLERGFCSFLPVPTVWLGAQSALLQASPEAASLPLSSWLPAS